MRVRLLTSIAGLDYAFAAGEEVTVDTTLAVAWCSGGIAEPVAQVQAGRRKAVTVPSEVRGG